jgi:hypothetical protein
MLDHRWTDSPFYHRSSLICRNHQVGRLRSRDRARADSNYEVVRRCFPLTTQLSLHPAAVVQQSLLARCLSGLGRLFLDGAPMAQWRARRPPVREDQIDQAERRETLANDLKVLQQQGSTFHQHAQAQALDTAGGRFAAVGTPRVVGSTPNPSAQYPAAAAHQADPVGVEPPLGYDVNAMPEQESSMAIPYSSSVEATGGAAAPSATSDVEPAPPSSSANDGPTSSQGASAFPTPGSRVGPSSNKRSG